MLSTISGHSLANLEAFLDLATGLSGFIDGLQSESQHVLRGSDHGVKVDVLPSNIEINVCKLRIFHQTVLTIIDHLSEIIMRAQQPIVVEGGRHQVLLIQVLRVRYLQLELNRVGF